MGKNKIRGWIRAQESRDDVLLGKSNEIWEDPDSGDQLIVEGSPVDGLYAVTYLPGGAFTSTAQVVRVGDSFEDSQSKARSWMKKHGTVPSRFRDRVRNSGIVTDSKFVNKKEVRRI